MARCPGCGLSNTPSRSTCLRCGTALPLAEVEPAKKSRAESIATILYAVAFVSSCAGGGLVIWVLQLVLGSRLLDNDAALMGGFMVVTVGSLLAMIYGIRRWKAQAQGARFAGGLVHDPTPSPLATARTKELVVTAVALAILGAFLFYYFGEWEDSGGERRINAILYGLYMLLGKWGVATLFWLGSAALVWVAVRRRRGTS